MTAFYKRNIIWKVCREWYHTTNIYKRRFIRHFLETDEMDTVRWLGECYFCSLRERISYLFDQWLTSEQKSDIAFCKKLTEQIVYAYWWEGFAPHEYFTFGFYKHKKDRTGYMGQIHKHKVLSQIIGAELEQRDLNDKYEFYKLMHPYFHRDVCEISASADKKQYIEFVNKHKEFILKPVDSCIGHGIRKIGISAVDISDADKLWNELTQGTDRYVAEELIIQSSAMSQWCESCVNTVRVNAFLCKLDDTAKNYVFVSNWPYFKTGRRGSVVDNAGAGGLVCIADEKTGVICSNAYSMRGEEYECHPDSKLKYKGWQIPDYQKLLQLSEEIIRKMPKGHRFVGFDFAYTDKFGWVLVEGNWGDFEAAQICGAKDVKKNFYKYLS